MPELAFADVEELQDALARHAYLADRGLTTAIYLALSLGKPLLLEGEAGVGKTEVGKTLARILDAELIRLQCYEGIDASQALYEWDYARQLLELRLLDATGTLSRESARRELYSEAFLIKRPLLQAIDPLRTRPAVLLIDEIDRADEEFEGFLLELLPFSAQRLQLCLFRLELLAPIVPDSSQPEFKPLHCLNVA